MEVIVIRKLKGNCGAHKGLKDVFHLVHTTQHTVVLPHQKGLQTCQITQSDLDKRKHHCLGHGGGNNLNYLNHVGNNITFIHKVPYFLHTLLILHYFSCCF